MNDDALTSSDSRDRRPLRLSRRRAANMSPFRSAASDRGSVSLTGSGRLIDWSIRNRPAIHQLNGYSHFAIKAERDGKLLDARVLNGPYEGVPTGSPSTRKFDGYGFGANRDSHGRRSAFRRRHVRRALSGRRDRVPARRVSGEGADDGVQPVHPPQRPRFLDAGGAVLPSTSRTTPTRRSTTRSRATLGNYGCDSGVHVFSTLRRL